MIVASIVLVSQIPGQIGSAGNTTVGLTGFNIDGPIYAQ